jgi:prephenate dehydrogenase
MKTVAIFGVGLIGGSFALALRKAGFSGQILGVSSPETIQRALDLKVIDDAAEPEQAAHAADLIYLSQPILQIIDSLPQVARSIRPSALVTDAGSTKSEIVQSAAALFSHGQFLGGHPMAGRERRGVDAAEGDLFSGRPYVLTPHSITQLEQPNAQQFQEWLAKIGAVPIVLDPAEHDRIVAFTSHLPQLASTALAAMLSARSEPKSRVFGPALLDSTRLALSSFDIWGDIFATNRAPALEALSAYIAQLEQIRTVFETAELREQFDRASEFAALLREPQ